MSDPLIQLDSLEARRGDLTLRVPAWTVSPGAIVGVIGHNGAGKTTLLRLLAGFDAPQRGSVRVFGLDPVQEPVAVRRRLGWVGDEPLFDLRAAEVLRFTADFYPSWDRALERDLCARFPFPLQAPVRALSLGELTSLRLVLALAFAPTLALLDEPTTGLDLERQRNLLRTLLEIAQEPQRAVLLTSHRLEDVERCARHLLVLRRGEVVAAGDAETLLGPDRTLDEAALAWGGQP